MATTNLSELLNQKAALEKQIAEMQQNERADAIAQVKSLMAQHGLSVADIASKATGPKISGPKAGAKVAAKYRNPATGDAWSGRGLKPKWLQSALAAGRTLADFAV
jgi:DNA-binding protein H-NS